MLVVLPDALVHQWLVEMLRRFNLPFAVFDQERFEQCDSDNAFHSEQRVLCSLSLLTGSPEIAQAALDGEWDLLIVDEAHHLAWSEDDSSLAYQLVEALAARTPGVLLLTATPEQLGRAGHFGRLRLLDPSATMTTARSLPRRRPMPRLPAWWRTCSMARFCSPMKVRC